MEKKRVGRPRKVSKMSKKKATMDKNLKQELARYKFLIDIAMNK